MYEDKKRSNPASCSIRKGKVGIYLIHYITLLRTPTSSEVSLTLIYELLRLLSEFSPIKITTSSKECFKIN